MNYQKLSNQGLMALLKGNNELKKEEYANAIEYYEVALENYQLIPTEDMTEAVIKNLGSVFLNLSASYIAINKFESAISCLEKAQEKGYNQSDINRNLSAAYYNSGLQHQQDENIEKAIVDLIKAKDIDKENTDIIYNLGISLMKTNDYKRAINEFVELIALKDKCNVQLMINTYCKIVECQWKSGNNAVSILEEAVKYFSALSVDLQKQSKAEGIFIYSHLIEKYLIADGINDAILLLKHAIKLDEDIISQLKNSAYAHYHNADKVGAIKELLLIIPVCKEEQSSEIKGALSSMLLEYGSDSNDKQDLSNQLAIEALGECNITESELDSLFS